MAGVRKLNVAGAVLPLAGLLVIGDVKRGDIGSTADLRSIAVSEDIPGLETVWIAGDDGAAMVTDDGGRSWKATTPLGEDLSALYGFWRAADGTSFLAGMSTNGGGGWLMRER